ncbi:MAG: sodium bicarbonate transporter family protein [Bryobacteraceae bacterium]
MIRTRTVQQILHDLRVELDAAEMPMALISGAVPLTANHWIQFAEPGKPPTLTRWPGSSSYSYLWKLPEADREVVAELAQILDDPGNREAIAAVQGVSAFKALAARMHLLRDPTVDPEVRGETVVGRTGWLFGGVAANIRRKVPFYGSDFLDGLQSKAFASVLFMFFACLAPAVAFGGLVSTLTNRQMGAIEMLVSTAFCGILYALFSGQPLTILGSTGPVIVFIGLLFDLCTRWSVPFLPALAWVGLWTSLILVVLAAVEASRLIRWFTRFTDEIFAALISLIFIYEALADSLGGLRDANTPRDSALLAVLLALGTFTLSTALAQMRRSPYLRPGMRHALADFGPAASLLIMAGVAYLMRPVTVETLAVPATFGTTAGRPWLVDLGAAPMWVRAGAVVPALLVSILLFLDQNITVRLVNNRRNKLRKGFGYHLDLLVVGILVGICSLFGLPWMVAATVRSLNHVQSLATIKRVGETEQVSAVAENRLTALVVHLLIGGSILILDQLRQIPMPVLFGLFLFMGISSMRGNQLFERMRLWLMDPDRYPENYYVRSVPARAIHLFTAVQAGLLALLWFLKTSSLGILFPLLIALLVPIRLILDRFFNQDHLALLDAEAEPEQEQEADLGPQKSRQKPACEFGHLFPGPELIRRLGERLRRRAAAGGRMSSVHGNRRTLH